MAGSPRFKIHNPAGEYVASCKHLEDAAALVANYGEGATIKDGGRIVWREGREAFSAGESYDGVHYTVTARINETAAQFFGRNAATCRARGQHQSAADYQALADKATANAQAARAKLA